MDEKEKELWDVVDRAIFKTNDPERILEKVKRSGASWLEERSSFGGSLRQIRRSRRLTTADCAQKAGISRDLWQAWEANRKTPSPEELENLCETMGFGRRKRERFEKLLGELPRQRLLVFSRFRPELLAARGVTRIETELEVQKLPESLREKLLAWCSACHLDSLEELRQHLLELKDDDARERWVDEVLGTDE